MSGAKTAASLLPIGVSFSRSGGTCANSVAFICHIKSILSPIPPPRSDALRDRRNHSPPGPFTSTIRLLNNRVG